MSYSTRDFRDLDIERLPGFWLGVRVALGWSVVLWALLWLGAVS